MLLIWTERKLLNPLCSVVPRLPSVSAASPSAALLLPPLGRVVHQRLVSVPGRRVLKLQAAVLAGVQHGLPAALRVGAARVAAAFPAAQHGPHPRVGRRRWVAAGQRRRRTQPCG